MYSLLLSLLLLPQMPPPSAVPVAVAAADTVVAREACVAINVGERGGSGTVIWYEDGYSVILTARHVSRLKGDLTVVHGEKTFAATRGMESATADIAVVWVKAKLPVARVGRGDPVAGDELHHWGTTTGEATGKALSYKVYAQFGRTLRSDYRVDPGDSGSGVFNEKNELVAVNIAYEEDLDTKTRLWSMAVAGTTVTDFLGEYADALDPRLLTKFQDKFKTKPKSQPPPCPDGKCPPNPFNPFQPRK